MSLDEYLSSVDDTEDTTMTDAAWYYDTWDEY
jgi:hypothetical protein